MDPSRGVAVKCAACGWAVVQVDQDGGLEPWHGVRTNKRAEMWA